MCVGEVARGDRRYPPIFCVMVGVSQPRRDNAMRSQPTRVTYGDSYSIGQLAQQWERDPLFVRRMIAEGKLVQEDSGLVTSAGLGDFYRVHGTELHDH